jgi:hypothetical protein
MLGTANLRHPDWKLPENSVPELMMSRTPQASLMRRFTS